MPYQSNLCFYSFICSCIASAKLMLFRSCHHALCIYSLLLKCILCCFASDACAERALMPARASQLALLSATEDDSFHPLIVVETIKRIGDLRSAAFRYSAYSMPCKENSSQLALTYLASSSKCIKKQCLYILVSL